MNKHELHQDEFTISTDKNKLNIKFIHAFLSRESSWAKEIPLETVERSISNSLCFGVYHQQTQVGFARVISDFATIAYPALANAGSYMELFNPEVYSKNNG